MIYLEKATITSVTLENTAVPVSGHPVGNLLHESPEVYFSATLPTGVTNALLEVTIDEGTVVSIDTLVLVGVESSAAPVRLTDFSGAAVPGALVTEYDDPYYPGRRNVWMQFDAQTGTALRFLIYIDRLTAAVGEVVRAGVLLAGITRTQTGVMFPLQEAAEDPTVQIQMADGTMYRGSQLAPVRSFAGTVRDSRSGIETFCDTGRRIAGDLTAWQLAPELGDRYFVYGRSVVPPNADHAWPQTSTANFAVREMM